MARSGGVIPAQPHANVYAYLLQGVQREADANLRVLLERVESWRSAMESNPSMPGSQLLRRCQVRDGALSRAFIAVMNPNSMEGAANETKNTIS